MHHNPKMSHLVPLFNPQHTGREREGETTPSNTHLPRYQQNPNESTHQQLQIVLVAPPRRRNSSPRLRISDCRIYDYVKGTTCHQCRQKMMDIVVLCKNQGYENKSCGRWFCVSCALNRYVEVVEESNQLNDWICLKCERWSIISLFYKFNNQGDSLARFVLSCWLKCAIHE